MSEESETPWATVQRLRSGGESFDKVVLALQARGVSREDIELLLQDDADLRAWSRGAPVQLPEVAPIPAPPPPSAPADSGRVLRWAAITISALAGGLLAASARSAEALALVGIALGPASVLVALELKKGLRRTAKSLGYVLFFAFILPTLSGFIGGWQLAQVSSAALFLSSVPLLIWASRTGEKLEGLAAFGVGGTVFENGDVQFCVAWSDGQFGPGETVELKVSAQNCVDVPRSLNIKVRGDLRSNLAPFQHTLALDPGCIVQAVIPVRVPPLAPARFGFTIDLAGSGTVIGRRVRLARGAEWVTPSASLAGNVLGAAALLSVGAGVFTLGSNGGITVKVDPERPFATSERSFEVKEVYRPDQATLLAAATS